LIHLGKTVLADLVPGNTLRMTDQQIAIVATEELYIFIIRESGLDLNSDKMIAIKLLDTIGKRYPAKIIPVDGQLADGGLQQPLVYIITEGVITVDPLGGDPGAYKQATDTNQYAVTGPQ
jgi:hypothetical protein